MKRQYLGCVGKVANGINTVHLAYVREGVGHALIGARQWIPAAQIGDPGKSLVMGLPEDLVFRTKGQLAIGILTEAFADGMRLDFVCGDEVYGSCTQLREFCEDHGQAYVLRVPSSFPLTLAGGITLTCKQAAARLGRGRGWEIRSAGTGSKGTALVRLGVAGHRLGPASPADPPPPDHRRAGLLLLLPARRPAGIPVPADPRGRAALAGEEVSIRRRLLRGRPSPVRCTPRSPALVQAALGSGRARNCPCRTPQRARTPDRPARRVRDDPAHRPGNRAPARPPAPAGQRRALAGLAAPPPGPLPLVSPANTARQRHRDHCRDSVRLPVTRSLDYLDASPSGTGRLPLSSSDGPGSCWPAGAPLRHQRAGSRVGTPRRAPAAQGPAGGTPAWRRRPPLQWKIIKSVRYP